MRTRMMLVAVAAGALVLAPRTGVVRAQSQSPLGQMGSQMPSRPQRDTLPSISGDNSAERNDPMSANREAARVRSFATERQRKMVQDTDKLLALATELKQQMDKTTKEEMSLDVIKKADEIERLAHDVKIRMKG